MNKQSTEIAIVSPSKLIELAISKDADVDKLEKLMALQERWDSTQAKKTFLSAKAKFQGKCPELTKSKKVSFQNSTGGKTEYNYIPLSEITKQTKKLLSECGLSYEWKTQDEDNKITISCILSHVDGHSEANTMSAGLDSSGKKNAIQQRGSTVTYLQRYTLIGALGISSADHDVDGAQPKKEEVKVSAKDSKAMAEEAIVNINMFEISDELQSKARPLLADLTVQGIHKKDWKKVEKAITERFNTLTNNPK